MWLQPAGSPAGDSSASPSSRGWWLMLAAGQTSVLCLLHAAQAPRSFRQLHAMFAMFCTLEASHRDNRSSGDGNQVPTPDGRVLANLHTCEATAPFFWVGWKEVSGLAQALQAAEITENIQKIGLWKRRAL